ncbi:MAG: YdeI/OmpD-associated family protein [Planctomycetota bacterium]
MMPGKRQNEHRFEGTIVRDDSIAKGYMKHYVPVPDDVARALQSAGNGRLIGSIDGVEFSRTMQRRPDGGPCIRFGAAWLRDAGLEEGALVGIVLRIDPTPDRVEIPDELSRALATLPGVAKYWASLTPGRRRTLAYAVERAKRPETRERRVDALIELLQDEQLERE